MRTREVEFRGQAMRLCGVPGDQYFEVESGLKAGEQVVTGPYSSVRTIADGDQVKIETPTRGR